MQVKDRGAVLDAGLVALGGGAIGGVVDTVPLVAGMAVLLVARAVVDGWSKLPRIMERRGGRSGLVKRWGERHPRVMERLGARPRVLDLDMVPQLTLVSSEDEDPNLAVIDAMTGLPNRRGLERLLDKECAQAARGGGPVAVLVLTLRDAGQVRRLYGPQAARDVLRHTGERLRRVLGEAGVVGRWEGEEFVVVVPGLRPQAAPLLAERYRRFLEAEPVRLSSGRRIPVAMGAGWAASPRDGISGPYLVSCAQGRAAARSAEARVLAMG